MIDKRKLEEDAAQAVALSFNKAFENSLYFPSDRDAVDYIKRIVHETCETFGLEDQYKIIVRESLDIAKRQWNVIIKLGQKTIDGTILF